MSRAQWYVVQVVGGTERRACQLIRAACAAAAGDEPFLEECFAPSFRTQAKFKGEWRDVEKLVLTGYVIAVTADPVRLAQNLWRVRERTKVLSMGGTYVPLLDEERAWLENTTTREDRVVPMSVAHKEDGKIVVTEGPLKGREGLIKRVNRSKSTAVLEFHVGGIRITSRVGLAVLNKE